MACHGLQASGGRPHESLADVWVAVLGLAMGCGCYFLLFKLPNHSCALALLHIQAVLRAMKEAPAPLSVLVSTDCGLEVACTPPAKRVRQNAP